MHIWHSLWGKLGFYYKKYFLPEGQYMWLIQCIVVISLDEQSYIYKYTVQCMDTTSEYITSSTVAMGAARDTRTCVWTSLYIAKDAWARILQPTWTEQTYLWRIRIIFFSIPSVDIKPIKDCSSSCWLLKLVFFLLIIFFKVSPLIPIPSLIKPELIRGKPHLYFLS